MAQGRLRGCLKNAMHWLKWLALGWLIFSVGSVLVMRFINPFTSSFMVRDRVLALWTHDKNYHFAHTWVDWAKISPQMKVAVIASEDQKFPDHYGFDVGSMQKAWLANRRGRHIRGGSTISQQVAKNLFLWPGQSYLRKGIEAWFTVLIETLWSKQRILEVYLNSAEFGRGVFGVGAASQRYFNKPASRLNSQDAALLAAVLPAPKRFLVDHPSGFVRTRQSWICREMSRIGGQTVLTRL
jgi:monofunctional glycosyltransferase